MRHETNKMHQYIKRTMRTRTIHSTVKLMPSFKSISISQFKKGHMGNQFVHHSFHLKNKSLFFFFLFFHSKQNRNNPLLSDM